MVDGGGRGADKKGTVGLNHTDDGIALASAIAAAALSLNKIDIVICTHADSDHASGLVNLLDVWKPVNNQ